MIKINEKFGFKTSEKCEIVQFHMCEVMAALCSYEFERFDKIFRGRKNVDKVLASIKKDPLNSLMRTGFERFSKKLFHLIYKKKIYSSRDES